MALNPKVTQAVKKGTQVAGRAAAQQGRSASNQGAAAPSGQPTASPSTLKGMGQQIKQAAQNMVKSPQAQKGALAKTAAALGALTELEMALSLPFSAIPFPAFPAARATDKAFGLPHAHSHPPNLIPPAPPVPLPSVGPILPIPYVSCAIEGDKTVLINNLPAARCGDLGIGIWCGGYFPMYEIMFGSSSVWIQGARAARLLVDMTRHCILSSGTKDPPIGPMTGTIITASPNVLIGGVPLPSLSAFAMGKVMGAMGKVVKFAFKGLKKVAVVAASLVSAAAKAAANFSRKAASRLRNLVARGVMSAKNAARQALAQLRAKRLAKLVDARKKLLDAIGEPKLPWMVRKGEGTMPKTAKIANAGVPMKLDPSEADGYLYVIKEDGSIVYAPQKKLPNGAETVKHTDLAEKGPARIGGEIHYDKESGNWVMDAESGRYSAEPVVPGGPIVGTKTPENLEAAAELARQTGTENIVAKPPK